MFISCQIFFKCDSVYKAPELLDSSHFCLHIFRVQSEKLAKEKLLWFKWILSICFCERTPLRLSIIYSNDGRTEANETNEENIVTENLVKLKLFTLKLYIHVDGVAAVRGLFNRIK